MSSGALRLRAEDWFTGSSISSAGSGDDGRLLLLSVIRFAAWRRLSRCLEFAISSLLLRCEAMVVWIMIMESKRAIA